ncbi:MAG: class I SAM-dependent methyltransferase [Bacteroidia bacterium]|nr:class I SAM-dependent methyltransferase [Bacteroidia bacterium]
MKLLSANHWKDYRLIDTGGFEKLEQFGRFVLRRPEPQAVWGKTLTEKEWAARAHATFIPDGSASGNWERNPAEMPDQWYVQYRHQGLNLKFRLGLTGFKHVGIFPEQAINWEYIYQACQKIPQASVLNLFAYTGGASLAARAGGADVIHCDSIRQVVNWANVNMEESGLKDIRWLVEDAFKFVKKEAKRGRQYNGIILDPPAWGHGPKGEKWKLDEMINEMIGSVSEILAPKNSFLVFNAYSLGYSPLVLGNLISTHFGPETSHLTELGELCLEEDSGRKLPAGVFARFSR